MILFLQISGIMLIILSLLHTGFPIYFQWKKDLDTLQLINRQMVQVHTFFIAFLLLLMGVLTFTSAPLLIHTKLGKTISLGLAFFWFVRLFFQWFVYAKKLWVGKKFETTIHYLFTLFWIYLMVVYFLAFFL